MVRLQDLEKLDFQKKVYKVSLSYLPVLCEKYYLKFKKIADEQIHSYSGAYKGILDKIDHNYELFELFVKYYILICRALELMGKEAGNHQTLNLFFIKDNLTDFIKAVSIITRRNTYIDFIELKFKLEEK